MDIIKTYDVEIDPHTSVGFKGFPENLIKLIKSSKFRRE